MVQQVRLTRLDVILILILVVAGAAVWPITSAAVALSRQDAAPRELVYQRRHGVPAMRVHLKGLEEQLGKLREKVVDKRLADTPNPTEIDRIQKLANLGEDAVNLATLALADAESAAAREYSRDLKWNEWKTLGATMSAAALVNIAWLALFVFVAGPLLALARLTPSWSRVLPVSAAVVLMAMGYQAGNVSGLIAFVMVVTIGGAVWLLVSSLLARPPVAQP